MSQKTQDLLNELCRSTMKLEIFKPSDFDKLIYDQYTWEPTDTLKPILCEFVNRKIQDYFESNSVEVFFKKSGDEFHHIGLTKVESDSHTARLICIEEIKRECEHEPEIVTNFEDRSWFECVKCGQKLKPKTWEVDCD